MSEWASIAVDTSPDGVTATMLDGLQDALGEAWQADASAPEVALAEEIGREVATTNAAIALFADLSAAALGRSVDGLAPLPGSRAILPVTVTVTGIGVPIPAGITVTGTTADGGDVAFTTTTPLVATSTSMAATLSARDLGADGNGVMPGPLRINNTTAGVVAITATDTSSGGSDPETLPGYLTRLRDYRAIYSPGGVRAADLAPLVRSVPGVQRALAIDLLDVTIPGSDPVTRPAERTVSIFPVDASGDPVPADVSAAVTAAIQAVREVNFIVRTASPTYTPLTVTFAGIAKTGAEPAIVRDAVIGAISAYLDPARWGGTPRLDGAVPTDWTETTTVRWLDLVRAAGSVDGLAHLTSITLNGAQADVTLPGPAALPSPATAPTPTTITGTVT